MSIMRRILKNTNEKRTTAPYPDYMKAFASMLHFYSSKAYEYVSEHLSIWPYQLQLQLAFVYLTLIANQDSQNNRWRLEVASCRRHETKQDNNMCINVGRNVHKKANRFISSTCLGLHWLWNRTRGLDDDQLPFATYALVFMVVGVNGHWKIPIGNAAQFSSVYVRYMFN